MANTDCYIFDIYDIRSLKSYLCRFLVRNGTAVCFSVFTEGFL